MVRSGEAVTREAAKPMNESTFRQHIQTLGYGEAVVREYEPNRKGDLHAHEFSAILFVLRGTFTLAFESESVDFGPGDMHEVDAGVRHDERTGPAGATVLLATK